MVVPRIHPFPSPLGPSLRPMLRNIGLSSREADVYMALLPLKVARVSRIAKAAGQSRSHTYLVLRSLEEKGLIGQIERGKVIEFIAESPQKLMSYLEERGEEIENLKPVVSGALPYLQSLTSPLMGQPRVTTLHGMDGMKKIYREMLPNEFCALFNPSAMYQAFHKNIVQMLFGDSLALKGRDLLTDNDSARQFAAETPQNEHYEIRLLPPGISFNTDTIVCGDTMALFAYDSEKTIIRIQNQNIANAFRAWFEVMWKIARSTR